MKKRSPVVVNSEFLYLSEIAQTPLLTPEQEIALFQALERGDGSAKEKIVSANLLLVAKMARERCGRGVEFFDLMQEGSVGLLKAVEKFDWRRGCKFSTVAHWWILQSLTRALHDQSNMIRIPEHIHTDMSRCRRAERILAHKLGRKPTRTEIAEHLHMKPQEVVFADDMPSVASSLDAPVKTKYGQMPYDEILIDEESQELIDGAYVATMRGPLAEMIATLKPQWQRVLVMRYGFDGEGGNSWLEISKIIGLTHQRVGQIEAIILRKLREAFAARGVARFEEAA